MIRLLTDITLTPTYLEDIELRAFDVKLNVFEGATTLELVKIAAGSRLVLGTVFPAIGYLQPFPPQLQQPAFMGNDDIILP